jgi:hypothetical protein
LTPVLHRVVIRIHLSFGSYWEWIHAQFR